MPLDPAVYEAARQRGFKLALALSKLASRSFPPSECATLLVKARKREAARG